MSILRPTLLFLCTLVVVATLLPLWRHDAWWVRAFEFPRLQIALVGTILVPGMIWVSREHIRDHMVSRVGLVVLILCVGFQAFRIFPYTPWAQRQVLDALPTAPGEEISILVANVLMTNRQHETLLRHVDQWQPDLVLTVENDAWWHDHLQALKESYGFAVERPLENTYGMSLYSKLPLLDPRVEELIEPDIPSIHSQAKLDSGEVVDLHFLHPKPPYPSEADRTTQRDGELLMVGRKIGFNPGPTILAGDLNDVAWSYTNRLLQRISGLLDPRRGRGLFSTFHARYPFLRWPLDHVFHSEHFKVVELRRLPSIGSDHFPIFVRLSLEPGAQVDQDAPEVKPGDQLEALEKIDESQESQDDQIAPLSDDAPDKQ